MTVKTTSQGVLHSKIWSLSGGLWPGDGSSKKVRGAVGWNSKKEASNTQQNHGSVEDML